MVNTVFTIWSIVKFPNYVFQMLNRVPKYKNRQWNQNFKVKKVRKTNTQPISFKRKQEKR